MHTARDAHVRERVAYWSTRLKVQPRIVRVQRMSRKWGSCSSSGIITLARDLVEKEPGFRDFVIVHEVLHLRLRNHSKLFKSLMTVHVPGWRKYDVVR